MQLMGTFLARPYHLQLFDALSVLTSLLIASSGLHMTVRFNKNAALNPYQCYMQLSINRSRLFLPTYH